MSIVMSKANPREHSKGSLSLLAGLLPFLRPYRREFLLAGLALIVAAGATLAIPYAFRQMIDLGFGHGGVADGSHIDLYFLALFGVACVLARGHRRPLLHGVVAGRARHRRHPQRGLLRTWSRKARSFSRPPRPARCCRA